MFFIRVSNAADVPRIAGIRVDTRLVAYRGQDSEALLDAQDVERREAFWRERLAKSSSSVFVIETDNEIVGFCDLISSRDKGTDPKTVGEIAAIYVLPDSWRQGAGKALGYYTLERARKRGFKAVTVWVLASSSDAMRFYESLGFARDSTFKIETAPDGGDLHELRYRVKL